MSGPRNFSWGVVDHRQTENGCLSPRSNVSSITCHVCVAARFKVLVCALTVICNDLVQNVSGKLRALPVCRPGNESAALVPAVGPIESLDDDARLSTLVVAGQNGTIFDLSPSFQADVAQYGAMVGADCTDATLCFETLEG